MQAQNANVTVEIQPAPVERQMPTCRCAGETSVPGCEPNVPQLVHVTVQVSKALATLRGDSVQAFVDLAGLGSGRYISGFRSTLLIASGSSRLTRPSFRWRSNK
jgi:hypothetical protein